MSEYDYTIKFFEENGEQIDIDGFCISADEEDLRDALAEEKAEEMMIQYDAHSYELTLEDVH